MENSATDLPINLKPVCYINYIKSGRWKTIWILPLFLLLLISAPSQAQETGPLLMKQELGYTLGGSVFGAGLGVVVWFMDPLNPSVTLKSTAENLFEKYEIMGSNF